MKLISIVTYPGSEIDYEIIEFDGTWEEFVKKELMYQEGYCVSNEEDVVLFEHDSELQERYNECVEVGSIYGDTDETVYLIEPFEM